MSEIRDIDYNDLVIIPVQLRGVSHRLAKTIASKVFLAAWEIADREDKHAIYTVLKRGDLDALIKLVDEITYRDVRIMSQRQLRKKASELGISYYGNYNRGTLRRLISNAEQAAINEGNVGAFRNTEACDGSLED